MAFKNRKGLSQYLLIIAVIVFFVILSVRHYRQNFVIIPAGTSTLATLQPLRPITPTEPPIININSATISELDSLDGIGGKIAQNIIDYRTEHGDFAAIEDIMNVSGIGEASFERIKNHISVTD